MRTAYLPIIALAVCPVSSAFAQFGTEHIITSSSTFMRWFRVVDLDNDGDKDVVGQRWYTGELGIYHNDGAGGFGPPTNIDPPGWMDSFEVGDLDSDGDVDIVYSRFDDSSHVAWLENDGAGQFGDPSLLDTMAYAEVDLFDLDDDGDQDIITGNGAGIVLLENNGAQVFSHGTFSPPITSSGCTSGVVTTPGGFVHADVNGDGRPDLLFGDFNCLGVYWSEGMEDGSFSGAHFIMDIQADLQIQPMDLDGDGEVDLAISDLDHFFLLKNDGAGVFSTVAIAPNAAAYFTTFVLRDCDSDGDLDFVRIAPSHIDWLERTGPLSIGGYVTGPSIPLIPPGEAGYLVQSDIVGSSASELFYSNGNNTVAYFGEGGASGSGIDDLENNHPHDVMVLSGDGAMVRIPGPMISGVRAFDTNGAEVRINVEHTGLSSVIRMPGVSPGLYFVLYTAGSRRCTMRLLLTD